MQRVVIVGTSLTGLRAAEALREYGFVGELIMVGDEPHVPYDRPPLSRQVMLGVASSSETSLPRARSINAKWHLGVKATRIDVSARGLTLSTGENLNFDRLLIATGTRARRWPNEAESSLRGLLTLRTREDAQELHEALRQRPRRVVVIGGGFTGCEIASACRELDLPVTLIERSETPLANAIGSSIGHHAAALQRAKGVDLRCNSTVERLEGDAENRVSKVYVSEDLTPIEADVVVVALGSVPNAEWLAGSELAIGPHGAACDPSCRAYDQFGIAIDDIFVAGDVARFPHPLFNFQFMTLEHWGNAVAQARTAAYNMVGAQGRRKPHIEVPSFWSSQFDTSIKSVGVPSAGDEVFVAQGDPDEGHFLAVYGSKGRVIGAVGFNQAKWMEHYRRLIETGAPFPSSIGVDATTIGKPFPAEFPHASYEALNSYITLSGYTAIDSPGKFHLVRNYQL